MNIRATQPSEQTLIAELWRRSWASANPHAASIESPDHWLARVCSEFCNPSELVVVESSGGAIGGFIVFNVANAYVAQLFTEPSLQGQGLGRALLGEAVRRMPQGWSLHVATTNRRAQLFYERYGLVRGPVDTHPTTGRERVAYMCVAGINQPTLLANPTNESPYQSSNSIRTGVTSTAPTLTTTGPGSRPAVCGLGQASPQTAIGPARATRHPPGHLPQNPR